MLANAFEALKTYDWGTDLGVLDPIEKAVIDAHGHANANRELESRLIDALKEPLSRDAHDYVCRKLSVVGTAAAVPGQAQLLSNKDRAHMARFALERINAPEAAQAMRDALPKVDGNLKVGLIGSLGAIRDKAAVKPIGDLLKNQTPEVSRAAALSLGMIGSAEAVAVLQSALQAGAGNAMTMIDALFACAESLLRHGQKADAAGIYNSLADERQGRLIRLAATRGLLACDSQHG